MGDKSCNRCGKRGLTWDQDFHRKTGKWKLENHKTVTGKWCNKPKEVTMGRKSDYYVCELCSETNFGKVRIEEKGEHIKMFHPNNEKLSELDYINENMTAYTIKRYWKHDPHYEKYV
jgi:hypothetical protein